MEFVIKYGTPNHQIDVTTIAHQKCQKQQIICIPRGDCKRALLFTDPVPNVLKCIYIEHASTIITYDHDTNIYIDLSSKKIYTRDKPQHITDLFPDFEEKLHEIHSKLSLKHGSFNEEYPEQLMAAKYLTGGEKVLEIGGNIGRNSLVIAYLLDDDKNLVVLESDKNIAKLLTTNKLINNMNFHIESSALSMRKLVQRGWETKCSDVVPDGYISVDTITLQQLKQKYQIEFDTLVLDCEGAFYYILTDMPDILNGVNLIIMENDYFDITHKEYIDKVLIDNDFSVDHSEAGGWGPCANCFYQVWKR